MGRRGPPPKPTLLKLIAGNPGKRRLNSTEPTAPPISDEPPEWLCDEAKRTFRQLVADLRESGILTKLDRLALGHLCQLQAMIQDGYSRIAGDDESQAVKEIQGWLSQWRQLAQSLGMTPSARGSLHADIKKPESALNEFRKKRRV